MVLEITDEPRRILEETSYPSGVSFLFQPDTILPLQYFEMVRRKSHREGEMRLMLAVLEDAIGCFQKYYSARDRRGKQLFHEAEEWIMEKKDDEIFSFNSICEALEINPDYLRRGLLQWKGRKVSSHGPGKGKKLKTAGKDPACGRGCKTPLDKEPEKYLTAAEGRSQWG